MIYAMSDIHGCIDELKEMMKKVDIAENNRIVFLGDYMDYGDNSYQVLKYLKDLQGRYGVDEFGRFLTGLSVVWILLELLTRRWMFGLLFWATVVYLYYRTNNK